MENIRGRHNNFFTNLKVIMKNGCFKCVPYLMVCSRIDDNQLFLEMKE